MSDLSPECALKQTSADPRAPNPDTPSSRYHRIPAATALRPISDFQNFRLTAGANQHYSDLVPSHRGALRNVINAGRDAVDAAAQLTNSAEAYGQVVWFRRPNAGVKSARRRAGDGVKQAWSPGRARSKP
jgi:hypothetical protein